MRRRCRRRWPRLRREGKLETPGGRRRARAPCSPRVYSAAPWRCVCLALCSGGRIKSVGMGDGGWGRHRGRRNARKFRIVPLSSRWRLAPARKNLAQRWRVLYALDYATRMPCLFLDNNSCSRFGRSLVPSPRRSQPWFMKSASRAASEAVSVAASTQNDRLQ